jgi:two-component system, sensor histidine kinase YesM
MTTFYINLRIRHKILLMSVIIIVLSSLSTLISYHYLSNELRSKTLSFSAASMSGAISEMDRFFDELDMLAFTTCSNGDLQKFILQSRTMRQYDYIQLYTTVTQVIGQISIPRDDVKVHIFSETLEKPILAQAGVKWLNDSYRFQDDDWYHALNSQTLSNRVIIANGTQHYYQPTDASDVVTCAYRIFAKPTLEVIGYLVIDINKSYFDHFFTKTAKEQSEIHLLLPDLTTIYQVPHASGTDLSKLQDLLSSTAPSSQQILRLDGKDHLVAFGHSQATGWKYISLLAAEGLLSDIKTISIIFTISFAAVTLLAAALSLRLARSITTPLENLIVEMKLAKKGHRSMTVPIHSHDESGELISNYNDLMVEINDLLARNESMAILKKEAELNALQQQINPHFIFNTLEIMIGLACEGDIDIVIVVCKSLGRMLSYNLDARKYVALKDELRHVANYISIIENRMNKRFETCYDVDPQVQGLMILKFIVQPLVENSIVHGFADTLEGGMLQIGAYRENDRLCIEIADNGRGMDEETRQQLLLLPTDYAIENDKRIGVRNVFKRLSLNFGVSASFDIISSPGHGTQVLIKVPVTST